MPKTYYEINQAHICRRLNVKSLHVKRHDNYAYLENGILKSGTVFRYVVDVAVGKTGGYSLLLLTKSDETNAVRKFFEMVASGHRMTVGEAKGLSIVPVPINMKYMGEL